MKTKLAVLSLGLLLAACQSGPTPTNMAPGTYKSTAKSVDSNGTEVKRDTTTTVYKNANGTKSATVHTKTSKDPEGLMNKRTNETIRNY